jgi:transposase IS4-like protein
LHGVLWLAGDETSGRSGQSAKIFQIPEVPLSVQFATATITRAVTAAAGVYAPGHLGELTQYLPFELVDDVLEQTGTVQRRLRDLPSRTGVYFLLALAMFPQLGYARVWGKLTAGLRGMAVPCPSEKALRDLRRRLGPAPMKALFEVVAGPLAWPRMPGVCFAACGRSRSTAAFP